MLNISSILRAVLDDLERKSDNIKIIDDMHLVDKVSGVEYHLYDDYFQMTRGSDRPVSQSSFSDSEKSLIMQIKNFITDPEVTKDKRENYHKYVQDNRALFSSWYEHPEPMGQGIVEEDDAEEYSR